MTPDRREAARLAAVYARLKIDTNVLLAAPRSREAYGERNAYYVILRDSRGDRTPAILSSLGACYARVRRLSVIIPRPDGFHTPSAVDLDPHATFHAWPTRTEAMDYVYGARLHEYVGRQWVRQWIRR